MDVESLIYVHLPAGKQPPELPAALSRVIVIVEDEVTDEWRDHISEWIVRLGCLYMMAWGKDCSKWDDSVDFANLEQHDFGDIPDNNFVMTTWHEADP